MISRINVKNNAVVYLLYTFCIALPLEQKLSTFIIIVWLFVSLIFVSTKKIKNHKFLLLLPLLYIVYIFSLIYSDNFSLKFFEQKASLLAFPLLFYLNGYKYSSKVIKKALVFFVLGCLFSVIFCYCFAIYKSINLSESKVIFNPRVNSELSFIESATKGGNFFYGTNFSVFHHTTYYAMFLCFAISILLFFDKTIFFIKTRLPLIFLFSFVIFQISSRVGIIVLFIVIFYFMYFRFNKKQFIKKSIIVSLIILPLFFLTNPRFKILLNNIVAKGISFHNENIDSASLRLMTWDASIQVILKNPFLGVGVGDAYSELKDEYVKKRYVAPYRRMLNSHNQYFQLLVECGVIALLFFVIQLIVLYKNRNKEQPIGHILIVFLIIISINSLFESILNLYSGLAFYTFLYCILILVNKNYSLVDNT